MKVSRGVSQALTQSQSKENTGVKSKAKQGKMSSPQAALSAQVSLSTKAQQIKKATDIAKKDSVDEQKIAHFQNLIDGGKYKMDSASIADKLVDSHMKMPS